MSHPVITDPVIGNRRSGEKSKSTSFISFPVMLIMACAVCGLPPIATRLWAVDTTIHEHNDAIVSVIMLFAPYFLVALAALGLFMFIRAGQPIEMDPEQ